MAESSNLPPNPESAPDQIKDFLFSAKSALKWGGLSPLQAEELQAAVKTHKQCKGVDNAELKNQREQIDRHWASAGSTLFQHGYLKATLNHFGLGLARMLLLEYYEDYFKEGTPLRLDDIMKACVQMFGDESQRQAGAKILLKGDESRWPVWYKSHIGLAIKEYMIDQEHIEYRFRTAATKGNLIKRLVQANDEQGLLDLIQKDLKAMQQIVLVRPQLTKIQSMISARGQDFLFQMKRKPTASQNMASPSSSFFSKIGQVLGSALTSSQHTSPEALAEARALLSEEEFEKKTV